MSEYIALKEFSNRTGLNYELIRRYIRKFAEVEAFTRKGKIKYGENKWHFAILINYAEKDKILATFQKIKKAKEGLKRPEPFSRMYWTESSLDCYEEGMKCSERCKNYFFCSKFIRNKMLPPMKNTTYELIKMYGKPDLLIKYRYERQVNE